MNKIPEAQSVDANQKKKKRIYLLLYIAAITIIFIISFSYIFNKKVDLNGDNCEYYMLSTSIVSGQGYLSLISPAKEPTGVFPPGYPLLMSILRLFTPSFIAQKILNGIFLLGSVILLFFFMRRYKLPDGLAFVVCTAILLNVNILHFSTMMMSEMSFIFFSMLALWALYKIDYPKPFWKDMWFWLLIIFVAYSYHIRTQGITLAFAVICFLLISKKWKHSAVFVAGYVVCLLPWMIRNVITGVGGSRYIDQIFGVNNHRPEEGILGIWGIFLRCVDTLHMLITKAIPNSVMPYIAADYTTPATFAQWGIGIALLAIIIIGFMQFGRFKYFFLLYFAANLGIISLFNDPGGNRYLTTIIPFLEMGLLVGLFAIILFLFRKVKLNISFYPILLIVLPVYFSFPLMKSLHKLNKEAYPPNYMNFFIIAQTVKKELPHDVIVCSRKPSLFYMYGGTYSCPYKWTNDDAELIKGLVDSNVDYVVLDQLGFSSTYRYLYPAIEKNPELFSPVYYLPDPDTYLLQFHRDKAILQLGGSE